MGQFKQRGIDVNQHIEYPRLTGVTAGQLAFTETLSDTFPHPF